MEISIKKSISEWLFTDFNARIRRSRVPSQLSQIVDFERPVFARKRGRPGVPPESEGPWGNQFAFCRALVKRCFLRFGELLEFAQVCAQQEFQSFWFASFKVRKKATNMRIFFKVFPILLKIVDNFDPKLSPSRRWSPPHFWKPSISTRCRFVELSVHHRCWSSPFGRWPERTTFDAFEFELDKRTYRCRNVQNYVEMSKARFSRHELQWKNNR